MRQFIGRLLAMILLLVSGCCDPQSGGCDLSWIGGVIGGILGFSLFFLVIFLTSRSR